MIGPRLDGKAVPLEEGLESYDVAVEFDFEEVRI